MNTSFEREVHDDLIAIRKQYALQHKQGYSRAEALGKRAEALVVIHFRYDSQCPVLTVHASLRLNACSHTIDWVRQHRSRDTAAHARHRVTNQILPFPTTAKQSLVKFVSAPPQARGG